MNKNQKLIPMSAERREILLRLIDGQTNNVELAHRLTRYRDCNGICKWIIRHGYAGENLMPWLRGQFSSSLLAMVRWVIAKNNKENIKPILLGKDWA